MIYPAIHALLLIVWVVIGRLIGPPHVLVVAALQISLANLLIEVSRPRAADRRQEILEKISTLAIVTSAAVAAAHAISSAGPSRLVVAGFGSVLVVLAVQTTSCIGRRVCGNSPYVRIPIASADAMTVFALISLPVAGDQTLLLSAAAIASASAVAVEAILPFAARRLSAATALRLLALAAGVVLSSLATAFDLSAPVGFSGAILVVVASTVSIATTIVATVRFRSRHGISLGLFRSLLTYYGVPFRIFGMRRLYNRFVSPGGLAFDVGAHVGNRIVALRSLGARVIAVEPQPMFAALLRVLFAGDPDVVIDERCLGSKPGTIELSVSSRHPTLSTASPDWITSMQRLSGGSRLRWDQSINREVTTLDQLISDHGDPEFLKIDVEGFETEVLRGLSRCPNAVSVEYLRSAPEGHTSAIGELQRLGSFHFTFSHGESMRLALPEAVDADTLLNAIANDETGAESGDIYAATAAARLRVRQKS